MTDDWEEFNQQCFQKWKRWWGHALLLREIVLNGMSVTKLFLEINLLVMNFRNILNKPCRKVSHDSCLVTNPKRLFYPNTASY
jgi:hypothetical protein